MTILTLEVAKVPIGTLEIEGLLDRETGTFYTSVSQIATQFQFAKDHASRDIKALMGAGFQLAKAQTKLHPKEVNVVTLSQYEIIVAKLDRKGNKLAQVFRDDLVGVSLHQIFSDAFNQKFDEAERQAFLSKRQLIKETHVEFQGYMQVNLIASGKTLDDAKRQISYFVNDIYKSIFHGKDTYQLKKERGLKQTDCLRDRMSSNELALIDAYCKIAINQLVNHKKSPEDAVRFAINSLDDGHQQSLNDDFLAFIDEQEAKKIS